MKNEKLNLYELMILFKENKEEYKKYLDSCSEEELMNYAFEGLNINKKDDIDNCKNLEKTINQIDVSKLYKKYGNNFEANNN